MKYFAALLMAVVFCALPTTNGLTCYSCKWSDKACATEKLANGTKTEVCGEAPAATTAHPGGAGGATTAAGAAGAAGGAAGATTAKPKAKRMIRLSEPLFGMLADKKYHCFIAHVKINSTVSVERGCKETEKTDDCVTIDKTKNPGGTVTNCKVCEKDKCNADGAGSSLVSSSLLIMLSATLVGKLFFQSN